MIKSACRPEHAQEHGHLEGDANVFTLHDGNEWGSDGQEGHPFAEQLGIPNTPLVADAAALQQLSLAEVLVRQWPSKHLPAQYFWLVDPTVDVVVGPCGHFFLSLEYEVQSIALGYRPYSRAPLVPDR